jgi:preprotein translocase subunit SecG
MSSPFIIWTLTVLLLLTSFFMILLVLIQRGRGGGLAGAFGGQGGQSAFGTRAGDVFTKITVVVAIVFIMLASLLGKAMRGHQADVDKGVGSGFKPSVTEPDDPETKDAISSSAAPADDAEDLAEPASDGGAPAEGSADDTSDGDTAAGSEDVGPAEADGTSTEAESKPEKTKEETVETESAEPTESSGDESNAE